MLTVAVRFRPDASDFRDIDLFNDDKKELIEDDDNNNKEKTTSLKVFESPSNYIRINNEFNLYFDHVLGDRSFQDDIFSTSIKKKANDFLNGNNCCILTYGAKSSGKSVLFFFFVSIIYFYINIFVLKHSIQCLVN